MSIPRLEFKVLLIGDGAVGKTSLKKRVTGELTSRKYSATVGVQFGSLEMHLFRHLIILQIWDIAGQERFRNFVHVYFKGAQGALLVYDITRPETFKKLVSWIKIIIEQELKMPIVLIANKVDLRESMGLVSKEKGKQMANFLKEIMGIPVPFIETSALSGQNVAQAFEAMGMLLLNEFFIKVK